ncbi:hypothetical protein [Nocardia sp. NPDC050717]|uniref:hypothetical protein n=1 Tax=Nocardia sp. NPDC050717 TaxID=3157221 RepID=UPI0033CEFD4C
MRKLTASAVFGAVAAVMVASAGTAGATPPPAAPLCAVYSYPAALVIELTGGQGSPFLPALTSLQPIFCG